MDSHEQDSYAKILAGETATKIRILNDELRRCRKGGGTCITSGIFNLGYPMGSKITSAVALFEDFNMDNDPYGEHDFGCLLVGEHRIHWKIDYYDKQQKYASPDPSNPDVTQRIITIMLASEH